MNKLISAAALAAGLLFASAAPAATVDFSINAGSFDFNSAIVSISATGRFETAGNDGVFELGSGLLGFGADGDQAVFETSGAFRSLNGPVRVGLADLTRFSATLSGGEVTAISFATRAIGVPFSNAGELTGEADALTFDVEGVSFFDFDTFETVDFTSVTSALYGDQGGSFFVDQVTPGAVPEPASWAVMLLGMGAVGAGLRRRRTAAALA